MVSEKLSQVKSDLCLKAAEVRKEALADFETKQAAAHKMQLMHGLTQNSFECYLRHNHSTYIEEFPH